MYTIIIRGIFTCVVLQCSVGSLYAQRQFEIQDAYVKMRPLDNNAPLAFSKIFKFAEFRETMPGDRLGALQPVVVLRCVSGTPVDTARLWCKIRNRTSNRLLYLVGKVIDLGELQNPLVSGVFLCDSVGDPLPLGSRTYAVAPAEFICVVFQPESGGFLGDEIGTVRLEVYPACYPTGGPTDVCDPANQDTVTHTFYNMRRLESLHYSRFIEYHIMLSSGVPIPSVLKFCAFGPSIIADTLRQGAHRNPVSVKAENSSAFSLNNPVIQFDRLDQGGKKYVGTTTGDTLTSFPINVDGAEHGSLVVCARRGYPAGEAHRRWMDDTLYGPEPLSMFGSEKRIGDSLIIEMLRPSPDQLNGIINTQQSDWTDLPVFRQALLMDEAAIPSRSQVFSIAVPDSIRSHFNEGGRNFRFRITLRAHEHGPFDDSDPWLVDEIHVNQDTTRDVSVQDVSIPLSYSVIPFRQASVAPVEVYVANRTQNAHRNVRVRVEAQSMSMPSRRITCERVIDSLVPLEQVMLKMPTLDLNAAVNPTSVASATADTVLLTAVIVSEGAAPFSDDFAFNDTILRRIPMRLGRALAYDAYEDEGHHQVAIESGVSSNFGLRMPGYASNQDTRVIRYGGYSPDGDPRAGGVQMRFHCASSDTVFAYQFAVDRHTVGDSACTAQLYKVDYDLGNEVQTPVVGSLITFRAGNSDSGSLDRIGTYRVPTPIALDTGLYVLRLMQETEEPLNLCATTARAGVHVQVASSDERWAQNLIADASWYKMGGEHPFPFYSAVTASTVRPFVGDRGFLHFVYGEYRGTRNSRATFRRGTWVPVMRVMLGSVPPYVPTSVDEVTQDLDFTITPNPADNVINITPPTSGTVHYELVSLSGEVVVKGQANGAFQIDVARFATGAYFLNFTANSKTTTRIVVVK